MSSEYGVSYSEMVAKQVLDHYLGGFKKLDNVKPDWLQGMEIDRYYPTLGIAIEFQGDQHYRTVPGMHQDPTDFRKQLDIDTKKRQLIEGRGIKLHTINFLDLDRYKIQGLVRTLVQEGKLYAEKNNFNDEVRRLQNIRLDQEPDFRLMRKADGIARVRKSYYKENRNLSWWKRLLRKL